MDNDDNGCLLFILLVCFMLYSCSTQQEIQQNTEIIKMELNTIKDTLKK